MKSIFTIQVKAQNVTIMLEEEKEYNVMVQSLRNGKVLHAKSFKTRMYYNSQSISIILMYQRCSKD